jgi:hypothetical protein
LQQFWDLNAGGRVMIQFAGQIVEHDVVIQFVKYNASHTPFQG